MSEEVANRQEAAQDDDATSKRQTRKVEEVITTIGKELLVNQQG